MMRKGRTGLQAHFTKPVNAIRIVEQVMATGPLSAETRSEWESARDILHSTVTNRKFRQFAHEGNVQEEAMLTYVVLCAKMGDLQFMRDGLFQYRSIAQHANAASMAKVLEKLISTAEEGLDDDPENQTAANLVWECYKQVLELIKTTPRLDTTYHETARRALRFCVEHHRIIDFRRLCDMLKWHHVNMTKVKNKVDRTSLLRPELHIDTRVEQLKAACHLKTWRIAHETTEELEALGLYESATRIPNGLEFLATYYKGCSEILWFSKNSKAEHADALWRLFQHQRKYKSSFAGSEEEQQLADKVILAAAAASKNDLLDMLIRKQVNSVATESVADLLEYLSNRDDHREMCKDVFQLLSAISVHHDGNQEILRYFPNLKEIVLTRLITLLKGVYSTLSLDELRGYLVPADFMDWHDAESVLMNMSKTGSVSVLIDRVQNSATFTFTSPKGTLDRSMYHDILFDTASTIHNINQRRSIESTNGAQERSDKISAFYTNIREQLHEEGEYYIDRMRMAREILERETEAAKKEADHARQADVRRREELNRQEEERQIRAAKREEELRLQRQLEAQRLMIAKKIMGNILAEIPRGVTPVKIRGVDLDKLDVNDIAAQKYTFEEINTALQKMKAREKSGIRSVREKEEKTVDYTARAIREESIPLWQAEEEKLKQMISEARDQLFEDASKKHREAYDLLQTQRKLVDEFEKQGHMEIAFEYMNDYIAEQFNIEWPKFKKKVNTMILKQSINMVKAKLA